MNPDKLAFFLGGRDLEMVTIRQLLEQEAPGRLYDKGLSWGARASAYATEIGDMLARGLTPVLIELQNDLPLDPARLIIVDHHSERAGKEQPTSLHQVFALLGLPPSRWSRWFELVAANDRGYIPALVEAGAMPAEIASVRAADRAAQGITAGQEAAAEQAIARRETYADGRLTLIRLPHARTATVTDRLQPELGGAGYDNLIVLSPDEVNFYGRGGLVRRLVRTFPGGWYGGALPAYGYWGHGAPLPTLTALRHCLEQGLQRSRAAAMDTAS